MGLNDGEWAAMGLDTWRLEIGDWGSWVSGCL